MDDVWQGTGTPALVTGFFSVIETRVRLNFSQPSNLFACWKGSSVVEIVVSETPSAIRITTFVFVWLA
jgi:hypothetical protein